MHARTKLTAAAIVAATMTLASQAVVAQALPLVNKGGINPDSWVYGPRTSDTTGGVIWNPAKQELMAGGDVIGRTMSSNDQSTLDAMNIRYCTARERTQRRLHVDRDAALRDRLGRRMADVGVRVFGELSEPEGDTGCTDRVHRRARDPARPRRRRHGAGRPDGGHGGGGQGGRSVGLLPAVWSA